MKKLTRIICSFFMKLWWNSWWGRAIIHATFDRYKNSVLFRERTMYYTSIGATQKFSWVDFKKYRKKVLNDKFLMFTILLRPVKMCKKFEERNWALKKYVNLF